MFSIMFSIIFIIGPLLLNSQYNHELFYDFMLFIIFYIIIVII
jgi:hypothetical protein